MHMVDLYHWDYRKHPKGQSKEMCPSQTNIFYACFFTEGISVLSYTNIIYRRIYYYTFCIIVELSSEQNNPARVDMP